MESPPFKLIMKFKRLAIATKSINTLWSKEYTGANAVLLNREFCIMMHTCANNGSEWFFPLLNCNN